MLNRFKNLKVCCLILMMSFLLSVSITSGASAHSNYNTIDPIKAISIQDAKETKIIASDLGLGETEIPFCCHTDNLSYSCSTVNSLPSSLFADQWINIRSVSFARRNQNAIFGQIYAPPSPPPNL